MKTETALSLWNIARMHDDAVERITAFARACEKRGIERTKAGARATCCHECGECGGEGYVDDEEVDGDDDCPQCEGKGERIDEVAIDWSALDAEIAKENEDG